jgi:signal transduction histidine kinase
VRNRARASGLSLEFTASSSGLALIGSGPVACDDCVVRRAAVIVAIASLATATGVFSLAVARDDPSYSFAGSSALGAVALLGAGWILVAVGLVAWLRRSRRLFGALLVAAGLAWFLAEWSNPGIGSSLAFTIGLLLYGTACAPLVGHAVLTHPGRNLSWAERGALALAYCGSLVVLGILPTLFYDPQAQGCSQCPRNLLLVTGDSELDDALNRIGIHLGLAWAVLLAGLAVVTLVRATPAARRIAAPVTAAGVGYLALVAATFAASLDRGFLTNDQLTRRLWLAEAACLVVLGLGVAWVWVRRLRTRANVARLVVELAQSPPPGGLRDALAATLGDPGLLLGYPIGGDRLVDSLGRHVDVNGGGREVTPVVSDGRTVAVLGHRPGLLDDPESVAEVASAARLVLDNERLQAEVGARLGELQRSRARIVEAGDTERRRLDRDLHDGAQQRLVALSLSLKLLRSQLDADVDPAVLERLDDADDELRRAVSELRELAHGIFPAVLADEGLGAAIEALAEEARVPVEIGSLPRGRFEPALESAAYAVVAEAARRADHRVAVRGERRNGLLLVEVESGGFGESTELQDRVGALDGRLSVTPGPPGRVLIRVELPCGS